jgi:hypothetical protein
VPTIANNNRRPALLSSDKFKALAFNVVASWRTPAVVSPAHFRTSLFIVQDIAGSSDVAGTLVSSRPGLGDQRNPPPELCATHRWKTNRGRVQRLRAFAELLSLSVVLSPFEEGQCSFAIFPLTSPRYLLLGKEDSTDHSLEQRNPVGCEIGDSVSLRAMRNSKFRSISISGVSARFVRFVYLVFHLRIMI